MFTGWRVPYGEFGSVWGRAEAGVFCSRVRDLSAGAADFGVCMVCLCCNITAAASAKQQSEMTPNHKVKLRQTTK